jgi:hypothetical protein
VLEHAVTCLSKRNLKILFAIFFNHQLQSILSSQCHPFRIAICSKVIRYNWDSLIGFVHSKSLNIIKVNVDSLSKAVIVTYPGVANHCHRAASLEFEL